MPLNDDAINEILPFALEGIEAAGDILSQEDYEKNQLRKRGHQPGIAERAVQNTANRQVAHFSAGSAQFLANRYKPGVKDDGDLDKIEEAWLSVIQELIKNAMPAPYNISQTLDYFLCWYIFKGIHPTAKPGMVPVNGTLIENASKRYPKAFEYLQSPEGQVLCIDEDSWQAASSAVWHTLADGTEFSWDKCGGVCKFVVDPSADTIRVPDLRGMYSEVAGFDGLRVGDTDGDAIRPIFSDLGSWSIRKPITGENIVPTGAFSLRMDETLAMQTVPGKYEQAVRYFSSEQVVPSANKVQPRSYGSLACVYLGLPG